MHEKGENEVKVLASVGAERVRCPLLNREELCDLYSCRPITCRLYGIPTAIRGMGHTCGKSGFKEGVQYSTVNMDKIYDKLYQISAELVAFIKTKHPKMADILMPVSMALLTEFNNEYLGIIEEDDKKESNDG
jgi:Fe-S-cluster containining protein